MSSEDLYKDDAKGALTVAELIFWLLSNCTGNEQCSNAVGGNVGVCFWKDKNRIIFE